MSDTSFALLHPGVQKAIWAMGWEQFRPIQVESIHQILEGSGHLIISAQTASGKTEAAFVPIISKLAADIQPSVQALYVGPLKALINDQFVRVEKLCGHLEMPVHRWHGDVSVTSKRELRANPGGILLITPESLESNFINYGSQITRLYRFLQFVVIDELHSFLNNVRGIHLLSLLARLNAAAGTNPRIVGLSATLGDPAAARAFLCPDQPASVSLISDPNAQRETKFGIKAYLRRAHSSNEKFIEPRIEASRVLELAERIVKKNMDVGQPFTIGNAPELKPAIREDEMDSNNELDEIAADIIGHFTRSTNLVFVNSKKTIENLSVKLHELAKLEKLPADPFVVHHGSLSKELREEAEIQLKSGVPTTAICSSTLEMGIDIGAVRMVGQVDTPWSVSSLVQRLGRSGRHDGEAQIMRMYVRETSPHFGSDVTDLLYPDVLRAVALTRLMIKKWLEPPNSESLHASTLIHQILSCLKQTGGASAGHLHETLVKNGPFRRVNVNFFQGVLKGLGAKRVVEQMPQGDIILAPLGETITSSFDFYAAFKGTEEFLVRNEDEHIGNLPAENIPPIGEVIILAGRRWEVDEINVQAKTIFVKAARGGKAPDFVCPPAEFHTHVVKEMQNVLLENDEPKWLDGNGILLLRAARTIAIKSGLLKTNTLISARRVQWFPWIGSRGLLTLKCFASLAKIPHEMDGLSITYEVDVPEMFFSHVKEIVSSSISAADLAGLLPVKTIQKFDAFLADDLLNIVNGHDRLDMSEAKMAAEAVLSEQSSPPRKPL